MEGKKKIDVELPTRWDEVVIGRYSDYMQVREEVSDADRLVELCKIFSGLDHDTIMQLTFPQLRQIAEHLRDLFIQEIPEVLTEVWEHEGVKYVCAPDVSKLTAGQYVDLKTHSKTKEKAIENLDFLCAIVFRPEDEAYGDTPMRERAAIFREHMPMSVGYPVAVFFCRVFESSMRVMKQIQIGKGDSRLKEAMRIVKKEMIGSGKHTDTSSPLTK